jgi:hypothetical protein
LIKWCLTFIPNELQINKTNSLNFSTSVLDLHITINNNSIHTKIYDKTDHFDFCIFNYPHLDGDVPHAPSYGIYVSQLIRFARACSNVNDFNERNIFISSKLVKQGYRYHKLQKYFIKFYNRNFDLISKYNSDLKILLRLGISHPGFYGDVIYKLRKSSGYGNLSAVFTKIIKRFIKRGYGPTFLRHTACLVFNPLQMDTTLSSFDYIRPTKWETL